MGEVPREAICPLTNFEPLFLFGNCIITVFCLPTQLLDDHGALIFNFLSARRLLFGSVFWHNEFVIHPPTD